MTPATPAISALGLTRSYREHTAVNGVRLSGAPDSITGLLGRNGAGKSTLMRLVTAQEFASSGKIR